MGGERVLSADTSVVSDHWWHNYTTALEELNAEPNSHYPDCRISFESMLSSWDLSGDIKEYEKHLLSGWYTDETSDHELRAFIYANLSAFMDIRLEDVMILLKDTGQGRLFYAFIIDRESEEAGRKACIFS